MVHRHKFSNHDLERYFDRISLPKAQRVYDVSLLSEADQLAFLNLLQKHHLVKMPWENLVQHYSWHRTVNVNPRHLYRKMVEDPGRGGYCMEVNYFYHLILFSVNFQTHMCGSRIYHGEGQYGGWTHLVNVVTIAGTRYMLDGGFGSPGPPRPIPVEHNVISPHISPAQMRLVYGPIADNLDQTQKLWIYQYRYNESKDWEPMYCFTELEFTPADMVSMNFEPWLNRQTIFTHKVLCVRYATDKEADSEEGPGSPGEAELEGEIDGSMTINHDVFKWRRHGKKVVEIHFKKEQDRVDVLRKYFGITLAEEDREAIAETGAMIAVTAMPEEY